MNMDAPLILTATGKTDVAASYVSKYAIAEERDQAFIIAFTDSRCYTQVVLRQHLLFHFPAYRRNIHKKIKLKKD